MITDDAKCAKEIFETINETSNLVSADHCATRIRIVAKDNNSVDMEKLEHIDGVKGVFSNNGQIHLIIGADTVKGVYDELCKASGLLESSADKVTEKAPKEQSAFQRVMKALEDVF